VTTASRVAEFMFDKGLAQVERPRDIRAWIEGQLYTPPPAPASRSSRSAAASRAPPPSDPWKETTP
jgi:hypothetical protein